MEEEEKVASHFQRREKASSPSIKKKGFLLQKDRIDLIFSPAAHSSMNGKGLLVELKMRKRKSFHARTLFELISCHSAAATF